MAWWRQPWFSFLLLAVTALLLWSSHRPATRWPPGVTVSTDPIQRAMEPMAWTSGGYRYQALAHYDLEARVLSRTDYRTGREADLSPMDLALGWGVMSDQAVLDRLSIYQSGRWYGYQWSGSPPADPQQMSLSSSNNHIVFGSPSVRASLEGVHAGSWVSLHGKLLEITSPDGWHWRSSLRRDDVGDGACELFWVDSASVLDHPPIP